jgi:integrase/recombinase XerD
MTYLELYRGIRIGESMDLKMDDVILTPGKQKIIIRQGKGAKYDEIDIVGSRIIIGAIQAVRCSVTL